MSNDDKKTNKNVSIKRGRPEFAEKKSNTGKSEDNTEISQTLKPPPNPGKKGSGKE